METEMDSMPERMILVRNVSQVARNLEKKEFFAVSKSNIPNPSIIWQSLISERLCCSFAHVFFFIDFLMVTYLNICSGGASLEATDSMLP
jgi:hypothetical protein